MHFTKPIRTKLLTPDPSRLLMGKACRVTVGDVRKENGSEDQLTFNSPSQSLLLFLLDGDPWVDP